MKTTIYRSMFRKYTAFLTDRREADERIRVVHILASDRHEATLAVANHLPPGEKLLSVAKGWR